MVDEASNQSFRQVLAERNALKAQNEQLWKIIEKQRLIIQQLQKVSSKRNSQRHSKTAASIDAEAANTSQNDGDGPAASSRAPPTVSLQEVALRGAMGSPRKSLTPSPGETLAGLRTRSPSGPRGMPGSASATPEVTSAASSPLAAAPATLRPASVATSISPATSPPRKPTRKHPPIPRTERKGSNPPLPTFDESAAIKDPANQTAPTSQAEQPMEPEDNQSFVVNLFEGVGTKFTDAETRAPRGISSPSVVDDSGRDSFNLPSIFNPISRPTSAMPGTFTSTQPRYSSYSTDDLPSPSFSSTRFPTLESPAPYAGQFAGRRKSNSFSEHRKYGALPPGLDVRALPSAGPSAAPAAEAPAEEEDEEDEESDTEVYQWNDVKRASRISPTGGQWSPYESRFIPVQPSPQLHARFGSSLKTGRTGKGPGRKSSKGRSVRDPPPPVAVAPLNDRITFDRASPTNPEPSSSHSTATTFEHSILSPRSHYPADDSQSALLGGSLDASSGAQPMSPIQGRSSVIHSELLATHSPATLSPVSSTHSECGPPQDGTASSAAPSLASSAPVLPSPNSVDPSASSSVTAAHVTTNDSRPSPAGSRQMRSRQGQPQRASYRLSLATGSQFNGESFFSTGDYLDEFYDSEDQAVEGPASSASHRSPGSSAPTSPLLALVPGEPANRSGADTLNNSTSSDLHRLRNGPVVEADSMDQMANSAYDSDGGAAAAAVAAATSFGSVSSDEDRLQRALELNDPRERPPSEPDVQGASGLSQPGHADALSPTGPEAASTHVSPNYYSRPPARESVSNHYYDYRQPVPSRTAPMPPAPQAYHRPAPASQPALEPTYTYPPQGYPAAQEEEQPYPYPPQFSQLEQEDGRAHPYQLSSPTPEQALYQDSYPYTTGPSNLSPQPLSHPADLGPTHDVRAGSLQPPPSHQPSGPYEDDHHSLRRPSDLTTMDRASLDYTDHPGGPYPPLSQYLEEPGAEYPPLLSLQGVFVRVTGSVVKPNGKGKENLYFHLTIRRYNGDPAILSGMGSGPFSSSMANLANGPTLSEEESVILWTVQKLYTDFLALDAQIKQIQKRSRRSADKPARLPDKTLFNSLVPAKADLRTVALDHYLKTAVSLSLFEPEYLCEFLSTDLLENRPRAKPQGFKAGYLTKRGKNFGGWKRRFYYVSPDRPYLDYGDIMGGPRVGEIFLLGSQIARQKTDVAKAGEFKYRHAFMVVERKRRSKDVVHHVFCAETDAEREEWIAALCFHAKAPPPSGSASAVSLVGSRSNAELPLPPPPAPSSGAPLPRPPPVLPAQALQRNYSDPNLGTSAAQLHATPAGASPGGTRPSPSSSLRHPLGYQAAPHLAAEAGPGPLPRSLRSGSVDSHSSRAGSPHPGSAGLSPLSQYPAMSFPLPPTHGLSAAARPASPPLPAPPPSAPSAFSPQPATSTSPPPPPPSKGRQAERSLPPPPVPAKDVPPSPNGPLRVNTSDLPALPGGPASSALAPSTGLAGTLSPTSPHQASPTAPKVTVDTQSLQRSATSPAVPTMSTLASTSAGSDSILTPVSASAHRSNAHPPPVDSADASPRSAHPLDGRHINQIVTEDFVPDLPDDTPTVTDDNLGRSKTTLHHSDSGDSLNEGGRRNRKQGRMTFNWSRTKKMFAASAVSGAAIGPGGLPYSDGPKFKPSGPVFGVPLARAVALSRIKENYELPALVYRTIEYLDAKDAALEEGIYRLSGSSQVIKTLKQRFDADGDFNILRSNTYHDVHAIAGLLKLFLRELPDSVLTPDLHPAFVRIVELSDRRARVKELGRLVSELPLANYTLLRALTAHLIRIVRMAETNKMTLRNVGIVFSPSLGIPAGIFNLLILEFKYIFWVNDEGNPAPRPVSEVPALLGGRSGGDAGPDGPFGDADRIPGTAPPAGSHGTDDDDQPLQPPHPGFAHPQRPASSSGASQHTMMDLQHTFGPHGGSAPTDNASLYSQDGQSILSPPSMDHHPLQLSAFGAYPGHQRSPSQGYGGMVVGSGGDHHHPSSSSTSSSYAAVPVVRDQYGRTNRNSVLYAGTAPPAIMQMERDFLDNFPDLGPDHIDGGDSFDLSGFPRSK
ncbi:Rho GTPase activating protein [Tieghemiomyces parasiticus]|uniref:Rho GTPase activating protein n=1 Tax=Tieghemiomyces parasiticus TaxID=78921 RepID=A0A9W8AMA9_9FUNG|nr:Rho GTPase activating protein [Tieghemiomyces parasiticus]